ncbi:DUF6328 family protein [Nocardia puris]|uniref:Sodium:proton antiporter n=1 Tax=Nocardia puris TaxID=208602 RepID=A0A366DY86_9NOCA|nr:DUF6328 family protein [Nocardia puris]RBO94234.1 hypothetical protein DFR74_102657 [Nocardia puris]
MSTPHAPLSGEGPREKRRESAPAAHDAWNLRARAETPTQRLDRNWAHLLQELRVLQTGVQVLTGFLMILPFQPAFGALSDGMRAVYLMTAAAAVCGAIVLMAPVAWHRLLFRRRRLQTLVWAAHRYAMVGLVLLGVAIGGVCTLMVDLVVGPVAAAFAGASTVVLFLVVWLAAPMRRRWTAGEPDHGLPVRRRDRRVVRGTGPPNRRGVPGLMR